MGAVLVDADAAIRERLEGWLLEALPDVCGAPGSMRPADVIVVMAEFALAAVVRPDRDGAGAAWAARVAGEIAERYRAPRVTASLATIPATAPAHAWIAEALRAHGLASPVPVEEVRAALERRAELPPFAGHPLMRVEARYLADRLGPPAPGTAPALAWPDAWRPGSGRDIYELAHLVFFLSDFGRHRWSIGREALAPRRPALEQALERAAALAVPDAHWDLVGEIALAARHLRHEALAAPLLRALSRAQWADGAVPGWRGARRLRELYHATLIALLAFTSGPAPAE